MADFPIYDETTAPEAARPHLKSAKQRIGLVPNLQGVMAQSPELLAGYNTLAELFVKSSLPQDAKHVVWITASVENNCEYCVAAHSTFARKDGVPAGTVDALRAGKQLPDPDLEATRRLTQTMVTRQGWVDDAEIDAFVAAGYTHRNVLDIILGVGMKTLSNYTNHIAHTPVDPAWQDQKWSRT
jgi:AhpD family alkylhydroperoxidase